MNIEDGTDEAVRAVLGCSSVNRIKSVLNALEERLNAMNATPVSEHKPNDENNEKGNKVAVMIYSFSEVFFFCICQSGINAVDSCSPSVSDTPWRAKCTLLASGLFSRNIGSNQF